MAPDWALSAAAEISIHALREEGDPRPEARRPRASKFLSTPSARRATGGKEPVNKTFEISIHALREEGDASALAARWSASHFYPRPPRGGRPEVKSL